MRINTPACLWQNGVGGNSKKAWPHDTAYFEIIGWAGTPLAKARGVTFLTSACPLTNANNADEHRDWRSFSIDALSSRTRWEVKVSRGAIVACCERVWIPLVAHSCAQLPLFMYQIAGRSSVAHLP